ncbi:MAG: hypothetical protein COU47_01990 [Candidatus Niyogibacteria bacterium CG10_big_fil_rev_8_21_14_0_10_46_36]|uniref:Uncharacterized protein n=1 Tax=Candidatus Niyogibacteria bacterium CG10_big_fil_rev_8_21_14_0_10_46_36 TaxID=1974726 RepID=A0A2H0TFD7_9BACT|nr:MAG: hypothetical protein COU47_01990 [Candidatus Niyogibacteria bacterium CG10_big_fil_rev_8_21_14_0_10_46_36]
MSKTKQNILVAVLAVALLGTAYIWYSQSPTTGNEGISRVEGPSNQQRIQFLALLRTLKGLKFDTSFFQDPVYQSLIDSGVQVNIPAERGAINPFEPR